MSRFAIPASRSARAFVAAALSAILCAPAFAVSADAPETIAIVHARAYTLTTAEPVVDATIVIRDGRIARVAAHGAVPAGARVVDAGGRTVTPGLFNSATQLGLTQVSSTDDTVDGAVKASPLGAAFDVQYALDGNGEPVRHARAEGVTRAIALPSGSGYAPFLGQGALIRLIPGEAILERPRALMAVSIGGSAAANAGGSRAATWQLLRNALDEARALQRSSGGRGLAPRDQLLNHLDAQALLPVLDRRTPLLIQVDRESDIRQAIRLADEEGVRVIVCGGAEAWRVADALAAHRIAVILDPFANLPDNFDQLGARLDNAALLQRAGVLVAFALVDTFSGVYKTYNAGGVLREAAGLAVANGVPWIDALKAITLNPARIWGGDARFGTLAAGQDADLVIWEGDPLDVSGWPTAVYIAGRPVSLETHQTALLRRYRSAAPTATPAPR